MQGFDKARRMLTNSRPERSGASGTTHNHTDVQADPQTDRADTVQPQITHLFLKKNRVEKKRKQRDETSIRHTATLVSSSSTHPPGAGMSRCRASAGISPVCSSS